MNCVIRTLKRALGIACETGYLQKIPKIELAKNERHRERVITTGELAAYFRVVVQPCKDVAMIMVESGMRPNEVYELDWQYVDLEERLLNVPGGKTKNAKRSLALTPSSYEVLLSRYTAQEEPRQGWVFPAPTQSGHINESSIKHQHRHAISMAGLEYFEVYCLRHTFLSILGNSGCDPYTLCRIAGHADIQMGMRYCHTTKEFMQQAFEKMVAFRQKGVTAGGYREQEENCTEKTTPTNPTKTTP